MAKLPTHRYLQHLVTWMRPRDTAHDWARYYRCPNHRVRKPARSQYHRSLCQKVSTCQDSRIRGLAKGRIALALVLCMVRRVRCTTSNVISRPTDPDQTHLQKGDALLLRVTGVQQTVLTPADLGLLPKHMIDAARILEEPMTTTVIGMHDRNETAVTAAGHGRLVDTTHVPIEIEIEIDRAIARRATRVVGAQLRLAGEVHHLTSEVLLLEMSSWKGYPQIRENKTLDTTLLTHHHQSPSCKLECLTIFMRILAKVRHTAGRPLARITDPESPSANLRR